MNPLLQRLFARMAQTGVEVAAEAGRAALDSVLEDVERGAEAVAQGTRRARERVRRRRAPASYVRRS